MKLEVNQYVRVKGYIGKIININDFREPDMEIAIEIPCFNDLVFVNRNDIAKASYNIIDVIEAGDIVNGKYVVSSVGKGYINFAEEVEMMEYEIPEVESVLTKEQFENNCYRVKKIGED